jgi:serine/threonine protein kinase
LEDERPVVAQNALTIGDETQMLLNSRPELLDILRRGNSIEDYTADTTFLSRNESPSENKIYLMVMEYIEGSDLSNMFQIHLNQGLLMPLKISAFIISRICRALDYAHQYIVHRDISPENVLINNQGVAFLSDFGIAVAAGAEVHSIAGKVQYMAPEQICCDHVDNRSDIFALGLVAYEAATGVNPLSPPFHLPLSGRIEFIKRRLVKEIPPACSICRDVPEVYSDIIRKMLFLDPCRRYQHIGQVLKDIEKEYLYKDGFGPTNNSLAAYINLAGQKFPEPGPEQKEQLCFLDSPGMPGLQLKRLISKELFCESGLEFLKELSHHPVSYLVKFM